MSSEPKPSDKLEAVERAKEALRLPFPCKLYEMLEDADKLGFENIVSWNTEGDGFMVHDTASFMKTVVPQYFNQTKYKSFQRQLSLYGFTRIANGKRKGLRFHEKFRRGSKGLCRQMKPIMAVVKPSKGKESVQIKHASTPPGIPIQTDVPSQNSWNKNTGAGGTRPFSDDYQKKDEDTLMTTTSTRKQHTVSPEIGPLLVTDENIIHDCDSISEDIGVFEGKSFYLMSGGFVCQSDEYQLASIVTPLYNKPPRSVSFTEVTSAVENSTFNENLKAQLIKAWEQGFAKALTIPASVTVSADFFITIKDLERDALKGNLGEYSRI